MAHPYGDQTAIEDLIGTDLVAALTTLDSNTTAADVLTKAREEADNEIDAALCLLYVVPFDAITDTPATPGLVQDMSDNLTAAKLLKKRHADGEDERKYQAEFDRILARILAGEYKVVGATAVSAENAAIGLKRDTDFEPTFSGLDSDGNDRMMNW